LAYKYCSSIAEVRPAAIKPCFIAVLLQLCGVRKPTKWLSYGLFLSRVNIFDDAYLTNG